MNDKTRVLVTEAGGFIGHHLATSLKEKGYCVRGADLKHPEFKPTDADEFELLDSRLWENYLQTMESIDEVYALAADMEGMGFISFKQSQILHNNLLISIHTSGAVHKKGVKRYFYTSLACIYREYLQNNVDVAPLKDDQAYPAQPQFAYDWENLITDQLYTHYHKDLGIETRILRFHNIFSPYGTWHGGREKATLALSRNVVLEKLNGDYELRFRQPENKHVSSAYY